MTNVVSSQSRSQCFNQLFKKIERLIRYLKAALDGGSFGI